MNASAGLDRGGIAAQQVPVPTPGNAPEPPPTAPVPPTPVEEPDVAPPPREEPGGDEPSPGGPPSPMIA